jgi:release factor glutamine methyltransferase
MSTAETWTVGKLLTWTTDYHKKHGSLSPRLDAEVLLAHARNCQRIELYTSYAEEPDQETKTAFREMVRRRAEGSPVAYLVGHKEFYSASFEVNPDVLIPRPETEHLIVEALDRAKQLRVSRGAPQAELRIADVGTGSGIIAITLAKHLPHCRLTAIDISPAALEVARRNAAKFELTEPHIEFLQGDLLTACEERAPFDMILSNPPYVSQAEYEQLDKSVRDYEPLGALVAGPLGSETITRLLAAAPQHLTSDGWLIFEFSPMLADQLPTWLDDSWQPPSVTKDFAGHPRIVAVQRRS